MVVSLNHSKNDINIQSSLGMSFNLLSIHILVMIRSLVLF